MHFLKIIEMHKIRLIKDHLEYKSGDIIRVNADMANYLITMGVAVVWKVDECPAFASPKADEKKEDAPSDELTKSVKEETEKKPKSKQKKS